MMDDVATDGSSSTEKTRSSVRRTRRVRMTGAERREQLLDIGRALFADKGFEGTSVEEIAAKAGVSKPVVYEHFGGKEGLYAVVVDREMRQLLDMVTGALTAGHPRELLEQAAFALLDYIERYTDGFRILVRDSPVAQSTGTFASLISDIATQVEDILGMEFKNRGFDPKLAPLYAQALVGMVALTGQWWLDARRPKKAEVAAHLVNLAWHGLDGLEQKPRLIGHRKN
ncbi:TetR family transcriptional regulator [Streptomyces sp. NPDC017979]|uniref:TetR family transcriptional regulator n=1 Tax=Streptomyces sp. NPDC017979 TaxID=3365024 RepID=UPI00378C82A2